MVVDAPAGLPPSQAPGRARGERLQASPSAPLKQPNASLVLVGSVPLNGINGTVRASVRAWTGSRRRNTFQWRLLVGRSPTESEPAGIAIAEHLPDWFRNLRKRTRRDIRSSSSVGLEQAQCSIPRRHPGQYCLQRAAAQWPLVHARRQDVLAIRRSRQRFTGPPRDRSCLQGAKDAPPHRDHRILGKAARGPAGKAGETSLAAVGLPFRKE